MMRISSIHLPAIVLALVAGALTALPQVRSALLEPSFAGIYKIGNSDEPYYLARGQEVEDGHFTLANPYLAEHKDGPGAVFFMPDILAEGLTSMFGLSIPEGYIILDFILPALVALLTYAAAYALTSNATIALVSMTTLHLGFFFGIFGRPISPQVTFLFLGLWVVSLTLLLRKNSKAMSIVVGLLAGTLWYVYTYFATYAALFLAILTALLFLMHYRREAMSVCIALGLSILGAIPYALMSIQVHALPHAAEWFSRLGMLQTHFPSGLTIVFSGGALAVLWLILFMRGYLPHAPESAFVLAAITTGPLVVNHHVITGVNLEFSSHYLLVSSLFFLLALSVLCAELSRRLPEGKGTLISLALLVLSLALSGNSLSAELKPELEFSSEEISLQRYSPVFAYLKENTPKDSVVFAGDISNLIPGYTHNNVYYVGGANLHYLSDREVMERFFITHYFEVPFTEEFVREYERDIWRVRYVNAYAHTQSENRVRKFFGLAPLEVERLPQDAIEGALAVGRAVGERAFVEVIRSFRADYLLWDRHEDPHWVIPTLASLEATFGDVALYRLRQ